MSTPPPAASPAETPERLAFYERIGRKHMTPLWLSLANLVTPEPVSGCQPASWSFADIRAAMIEAGGLITAKEAERRVLILENPGLRGQSKITTDLYAGRAARAAGRGRARAPARAERAALRARRRRRAHGRERRAHADALRRLHHHAADGLARPRQRDRPADLLARRSRHPDRPVPRRLVRRAPRRGRAADLAPGRRLARPLRLEPAAGRPPAGGRRVAGVQLSVRAHARGAGTARAHGRVGPVPRPQDALQQSR